MADENININVKSNIGDVSKDAGNAASEFRVMGVSLNGVKAGFASAAVTAKGMFGTIKAGLMSTGIGALLIAVGALVSHFTNTKRGAEKLERAMAGLGAVVSVLTDSMSGLGEKIINTFKDPMPALKSFGEGLLDFIKDPTGSVRDMFVKATISAKELGKEIVTETEAMMKLKGMLQQLKDEEREFSKVRAQTRQDIQKARLDALDESKTAEERLAAVQKANDLELKTTEDVLAMQRRKIQVQKETMALSENMAEDLDELAALEVGLIDLQTQSFQTQKRLATEMETLTNEIAANEKAAQKVIDDEKAEKDKARIASEKLDLQAFTDFKLKRIKDETDDEFKIRIEAAKKLAKEQEKLDKELVKIKADTISMGFAAGKALAKEGSVVAKGIAVAETIYNTQAAIMQAMKLPPPFNTIQAVATGVMGATSIQKILSTNPDGGGGGGSVSAPATPATPSPQMMSGAFDLSGGVEPEPTKAYVVTDEMTSSQNQLANIRRRATI